jgi:asparagine synthase (glutamine-hydrolysing)
LLEAGLLGDLGTYLPHLLNRQDKNTMQRSIETRTPFLDPAVVELALNLPLEARLEPRRKGILRELGARHLPKGIAQRPKLGFGFDVRRYLQPAAKREFLLEGALREELGVDAAAWRAVVDQAESHLALRLWSGEIWCRSFLGGEDDAAVEGALWRAGP